ncbi:hypothetical protein J3R82DRAFT_9579 [Butyriboletus roseoflavus]|nr:hypothetical protein J3R82DRAFT_9579 [Butyriboletus roseoflavus]
MLRSESLPTFPFNADLTDCLLMALPDFQSLQDFISCSKTVYSIFRCRQNSILGAVAHSQFGSALPQALRLVRCLGDTHSSILTYELQWEADFPQDFAITPAQARLLRDNAAIVRALEDIYSWREKDPRSRSSRLSAAESLRFQRSVYRLWLLAATYGPGALVDEMLEHNNDNHLQLKDLFVKKQITFLLNLGEFELVGVDEVHRFLLDLAKWAFVKRAARPTREYMNDLVIETIFISSGVGQRSTLDAFRGKWPSFRPIDSQWYSTWLAMTRAFFATETASITGGRVLSLQQRFVLDDYFLKTIDYWEYMILAITPSRLGSFLSLEGRRPLELLVSFTEAVKSIPYPQFIEEIFNIRSERYKDWKKDEWLCTHCMTKLLSDNVQAWFDERTTKLGGHKYRSTP